ncbi:MAG TPA: twin-arginine translocase TatA/TatE family subunit [Actinomycetota bacterium]
MFNIGPTELIVILIIALLVFGPKRLPEVGRSIGRSLREFRRASDEIRGELEQGLNDDEPHATAPTNGAAPTAPIPPITPASGTTGESSAGPAG